MSTPPNREVALFSAALELEASQRGAYLDEACADDPALRLRIEAFREQEPERPSTRLSTMAAAELTEVAKQRQVEPAKLGSLIRGDLDWIVMKALEKDRARRYETANGLAADILRHLNCEPVVARPPSRLYEFQKTVRRHKFGFAAAAALITVLAAGVLASTMEAIRATGAERKQIQLRQQAEADEKRARTEAAKATAIGDFLQQSLRSANPEELKGSEYTVRQLLDDFSKGLESRFKNQPEVEAEVRATLGRAYYRLGLADKSQLQMERALTLRRRIFGEHEQVAATLVDYAWTSIEQEQPAKGEAQAREALDIYRKHNTTGQPVISAFLALQRTLINAGRVAEVETVTEEALTIARKSPGVEFPDLASMIHGLAEVRVQQSRYVEAETLAQKALAMHRRLRREGDLETAWALAALGKALRGEQKLDEAEQALQEALGIFRKQYAPGHKSVDGAMAELKAVLEAKGDLARLVAFYRNTLAELRAALGNDSPAVAEMLLNLSDALRAQGKQSDAEKASSEALDIPLKLNGQITARTQSLVRRQAQALKDRGKSQDAEKLFEAAILVARQQLGETNLILGDLLHDFGFFLLYQEGKVDPAADQYLKALIVYRANANDEALTWTLRELGDALLEAGKPKDAEPYFRQSVALYRKLHQQEEINGTARPSERLGDALYQQHKLPEAEKAYRDALAAYTECKTVGGDAYASVVRSLLYVLKTESKSAEGEALCTELLPQQRALLGVRHPAFAVTLCELAECLRAQNRPEARAQKYREALNLLNPRAEDLVELAPMVQILAQKLVAQGEPQDAERLYEDAIKVVRQQLGESHPALGTLLYNYADCLSNEAKLDAATEQCLKALQIRRATKDDTFAATLRRLGWLQLRNAKAKEAEQSFREALEVYRALHHEEACTETAAAAFELAQALFQQRKLPEAEHACREAIAAIPTARASDGNDQYVLVVFWLIRVLRNENKLLEADTVLSEVLSHERPLTVAASLIGPASFLTYENRPGDAETATFMLRSASQILQKLTAADLVEVPWWALRGLTDGGYKQQATNICRVMLDSSSTDAMWFNNVAWFLATAENPSSRDPALGVELAKRALELDPNGDWNTLGVARYCAGDYKQALADLEKSMQLGSGGSSFNYFFAAMAHQRLGNKDAARRFYVQAIEWMEMHQPRHPELMRFKAEAERLLGPMVPAPVESQLETTNRPAQAAGWMQRLEMSGREELATKAAATSRESIK